MKEIKLGSLCITKNEKTFRIKDRDVTIPKGTYVVVCDNDYYLKEDFVLVESEDYDAYGVNYNIEELILV